MNDGSIINIKRSDGKLITLFTFSDEKWKDFGWNLTIQPNEFIFSRNNMFFIQPHIGTLTRNFEQQFSDIFQVFNYKDLNVLDVGGYFGETAILFHQWGAKKILIYEPLAHNLKFIKKNIKRNKISAIIYPYAAGEKDGKETWYVDKRSIGKLGFGMHEGKTPINIDVKEWDSIITDAQQKNVTIAKINCEGGECYLEDVSNDKISQIPFWIIETHSNKIENIVCKKFLECDFDIRKILVVANGLAIYRFSKK